MTVVPGNTYNVVVGIGGAASTAGGSSTFNATTVVADGGHGGTLDSNVAGAGGTTANSTGTTKYAGGNGAAGGGTNSGGGNFFSGLINFISQKFGLDKTKVQSAMSDYRKQNKPPCFAGQFVNSAFERKSVLSFFHPVQED